MKLLTSAEVHSMKVAELGLDPNALDLLSAEAVSASLRRAAALQCPCSGASLVRAVVGPLRHLAKDLEAAEETVRDTLEDLLACGDLLEQRDLSTDEGSLPAALLYAAPPSFVPLRTGTFLLFGVAQDQSAPLPPELLERVESSRHVRRLRERPGEDLRTLLLGLGFIERTEAQWLGSPPKKAASEVVCHWNKLLDGSSPSTDVPGVRVLDTARSVIHYRRRWSAPANLAGRYVARRTQAFGADLWCFAEFKAGRVTRFVDMPTPGERWRGCDEAWWLQLALDAVAGAPQLYETRDGAPGRRLLGLFAPLPSWAQRRLDATGEPLGPQSGFLLTYGFDQAQLAEELRFLRDRLWLAERSHHGSGVASTKD